MVKPKNGWRKQYAVDEEIAGRAVDRTFAVDGMSLPRCG